MGSKPPPRVLATIADGFAALFEPPFRVLLGLSVLITVTSEAFGRRLNDPETLLYFALLIASLYVQIAIILAAGRPDPDPSADAWLRGAVRRRCVLRFILTTLLVFLGLLTGLGIFTFFIGALLGLAQSACVLERRLPMDAINRSARISEGARVTIGVVFGLFFVIPQATVPTAAELGWADDLGIWWTVVLVLLEIVSFVGTVGLTRVFVALGGSPTPPLDDLSPRRATPLNP